uniref:Ribosomal RNA methyltransferase FtsJ domain-containing protein n=1 Tax=viral metagenome TaxID=1070528 RepID=A0A6C0FCV1_9ZZZZ|tara:strand:- start:1122 stop:2186 length:1065 start_codon:yes stop_codon:yes gene_type:complete
MCEHLFHFRFKLPENDCPKPERDICYDVQNKIKILANLKKKIDNYYDSTKKYNIWNCMSRELNPYEGVSELYNIITISRAFFKLSEILFSFDIKIPPNSSSLHLCEAPGGFVQSSLLHFNTNLQSFVSISLDSSIKFHKDIKRNKKGTVIIEDITSVCGSDIIHDHTPEKGYEFITADGAFDVSDNYEEQEKISLDLLFNEITIALSSQSVGGTFIIKLFDFFLDKTWRLITWLKKCYTHVYICKPPSSRPVNSERYCVCIGFIRHFHYPILENSLVNFKFFLTEKLLDFQIESLEKVFHHITINETYPSLSEERQNTLHERLELAKKGQQNYIAIYLKKPNRYSSFSLATPYL